MYEHNYPLAKILNPQFYIREATPFNNFHINNPKCADILRGLEDMARISAKLLTNLCNCFKMSNDDITKANANVFAITHKVEDTGVKHSIRCDFCHNKPQYMVHVRMAFRWPMYIIRKCPHKYEYWVMESDPLEYPSDTRSYESLIYDIGQVIADELSNAVEEFCTEIIALEE